MADGGRLSGAAEMTLQNDPSPLPVSPFARERRALLAAVIYFTRIPLPALPPFADDDWRRATSYWPLIGLMVGLVAAAVYALAALALPRLREVGAGRLDDAGRECRAG
ncbi:MAG: hypothetical protein HC829_08225 [Bacteroidales bacterium]|nr:hypothetical protein [Bacteroidales bacterium]